MFEERHQVAHGGHPVEPGIVRGPLQRAAAEPGHFREQVEVILEKDGSQLTAWMYFSDTAVGEPVPSGVYTLE